MCFQSNTKKYIIFQLIANEFNNIILLCLTEYIYICIYILFFNSVTERDVL